MSMSLIVVLILEKAQDADYLNRKAVELKIPIIYEKSIVIDKHSGFYPLEFEGEKSGFEIYKVSVKEIEKKLPEPKYTNIKGGSAYVFNYGYQRNEGASAFYTAAILTYSKNGIVFDAEGGQYMGVEELLKVAKELSNIEQ